MNELLKNLVRLQSLEFGQVKEKKSEATIAELRGKIPSPILEHYDRLMARGKKGIVAVQNQVCSGCHMHVPMGMITTLMRATDIQLCDSCGRYLFLPDPQDEAAKPVAEVKPVKKPRKRRVPAPA